MIEPFTAALLLAFVSEIADKTQLVILALAIHTKRPFSIFFGALTAHAVMDTLAIIAGALLGTSLAPQTVKWIVGPLFIIGGIWILVKFRFKKQKRKEASFLGKQPFAIAFLTVAASEFGDKTQIASGLLAAKYGTMVPVLLGFVIGLAVVIGLNVFVGSKLAENIPRKTIKVISATLFILFGVVTLIR
ncbi:TMEM165/GDT1 family protein [Candidatus Woesearchaeota archaeon]|nr:TMEM165/GDT1 family protein [Candidatus Woesearchaeota archaeon]